MDPPADAPSDAAPNPEVDRERAALFAHFGDAENADDAGAQARERLVAGGASQTQVEAFDVHLPVAATPGQVAELETEVAS